MEDELVAVDYIPNGLHAVDRGRSSNLNLEVKPQRFALLRQISAILAVHLRSRLWVLYMPTGSETRVRLDTLAKVGNYYIVSMKVRLDMTSCTK